MKLSIDKINSKPEFEFYIHCNDFFCHLGTSLKLLERRLPDAKSIYHISFNGILNMFHK